MDAISEMFVSPEDPTNSERRTIADQPITLFKPKKKPTGLTFVLTAANIPLSKYSSIITALTSSDHVVVGLFVNVLNPPLPRNHRVKAERIVQIFDELKSEFGVREYSLVGHSIGGKIALLVVALYDEENLVRSVVALDPVDQSPVEFTNETRPLTTSHNPINRLKVRENLSLENSKADITVTFTDTGYFIGKKHNAREIQKNNPSIKLVMHRNSCHMVYCDDGGLLSWKALMGRGKSVDRNQVVKDETIQLIKDRAMRSTLAGYSSSVASGAVTSSVSKAKKSLTNGISVLKEMKGEAEKEAKKGVAMAGVANAFKVLG